MTAEPLYTPPFELWKTDHGVDGHDARTWLVARFTEEARALRYLSRRGYTHNGEGRHFYHEDHTQRNCMGSISYEIRTKTVDIPVDPE